MDLCLMKRENFPDATMFIETNKKRAIMTLLLAVLPPVPLLSWWWCYFSLFPANLRNNGETEGAEERVLMLLQINWSFYLIS